MASHGKNPFLRLALCLTLGLASCATPLRVPDGFVQMKQRGELLARTGDNGVLRVYDVSDPTEASDAAFWLEALRSDFVGQRGYRETGSGEIVDADGVPGRWLTCSATVGGVPVGHLIAVWTRRSGPFGIFGRHLQVVEFAAQEPVYAARIEAVKKALATVRD